MKATLSPFGDKRPPFKTLKDAAEAAADILAHLSFVDDDDAAHARAVERQLRKFIRRGGK